MPGRTDHCGRGPWIALHGLAVARRLSWGVCLLYVAAAGDQPTTRPAGTPALAADRSLERRLTRRLGPRFKAQRTPHFSILSDTNETRVARLKDTAEETWADVGVLADRLGLRCSTPSSKMTVVFFDDWSHYEARAKKAGFHVDPTVPGFFSDRDNQCLMFNFANAGMIQAKRREVIVATRELSAEEARMAPGDEAARRRLDEKRRRIRETEGLICAHERLITQTVVRHEIAHQVLFNVGLQSSATSHPRWLREGLATQFETRGAVNGHRLEDFLAAAEGGRDLGLRALVGDPKHIGPGADDLPARYATAWALVAYLVERRPRAFAAYIAEQGRTPSVAQDPSEVVARFEAAFGDMDEGFQAALSTWARRLREAPPAGSKE